MSNIIDKIGNEVRIEVADEFDRNFERKAFFDKSWDKRKNARGSLMIVIYTTKIQF
ncbi:MAG: hypothetical protein SNG97_06210 [Rikenellaceae bacterium]